MLKNKIIHCPKIYAPAGVNGLYQYAERYTAGVDTDIEISWFTPAVFTVVRPLLSKLTLESFMW